MRLGVLLSALATGAVAQGMAPIADLVQADGPVPAYTRCAGFLAALQERGSEAEFGPDAWANIAAGREDLEAAALILSAEAGDIADVLQDIYLAIGETRDAYLARFETNFDESGEIIAGDPQLEEDLGVCAGLAERAKEGTN
ncbi:hypothetical protein [Wenxinia marina]|uniref:Uncharacterized protein n=1 Tax=Wenxinia marina DSM 24838 TaxID=1123501 RepID=A0A0D0PGM6_9RHOB|nr:hypothetical protein [Wenxinia marina]KIQ70501.1 hypothetical protein Wenmar_00877 [Wenxinia marina DSM 24838]GGL52618.1 hypothetical protein GCM10011392_03740 [Wenxinia marina]